MSDNDGVVRLSDRRAKKKRAARQAFFFSMTRSLGIAAWVGSLLFAVVTYFAFGSSSGVFTADLVGGVIHSGAIDECGLIRRTCLVDGDTGWQDGMKWRLSAIDAPEMGNKAECTEEREKGVGSLNRLKTLMADGYSIKPSGRNDKYGGALVDIALRDGRDAGHVLVAEGFAQPWPSVGKVWCHR